ncbi:hypothetical protein [Frankia sp. R82]|uniref:hypothetical protein n=1 Tax=Frankia sp. R82 TaxID=2950553 RepID=UPI002042D855|nr:hypothetical protein [Frankia sp. R82]MCM3885700.1 hypothetical protein [Frankia sp. R82]
MRAARDGQANLTDTDLRRHPDPAGQLDELTAGGWITGDDLARILDAPPEEAFRLH